MLTRVAQDAERALEAVEQADQLLDDEQVKAAHELLRELIGQDFDVDQDGVPRLHRGTRSNRIISTVDPEMRHGRKSSSHRFNGHKAQVAVDTDHHLIIAHEVTNTGSDRAQLANMAKQAKEVLKAETLEAVADRGYFSSPEILACHEADITVTLPKQMTSGAKSDGRFGKQDFVYIPEQDVYRRPAGQPASDRPRVPDRLCFRGIIIRLVTGASWVDIEAILEHPSQGRCGDAVRIGADPRRIVVSRSGDQTRSEVFERVRRPFTPRRWTGGDRRIGNVGQRTLAPDLDLTTMLA